MALTIILLENNDIGKNTILGGNIDIDRYLPSVKACQQTKIKPILGKSLYDKLCADFEANTLTGLYEELYEDYVKELVIHGSSEIYLTHGAYLISNQGIVKTSTETSETVSKDEIDYLVQASRKLFNSYEMDLQKWFKDNGADIPEYVSNTKNVSNKYINCGGWFLRKSKNC